jgi:hypothetical protein
MRILTSNNNVGAIKTDDIKLTPQKSINTGEPVDKVEINEHAGSGEKFLSLGKKVLDYAKPKYIYKINASSLKSLREQLPVDKLKIAASLVNIPFLEEGFTTTLANFGFSKEEIALFQQCANVSELGDKSSSSSTSAAMGGGLEGFMFGGGPVGLVAGAIGGYAGTKIGEATKSKDNPLSGDLNSLLAGSAIGAGTGVAVTLAMGALFGGAIPGATTLTTAAILGGLSGASGSLSGNAFTSVSDGISGGVMTGLVAQALTGNSGMVLAGSVGGGVGGRAATTAGKLILGGGAGAATGALTAIPAVMMLGTAGLPIMGISAAAGAISGASGAVIGPVMRRTIRNITMDINHKVDAKMDKALEGRKIGTLGKTAAGAGIGVVMFAPIGLIFGGATGAAIGAGAGALIFGGKTLYEQLSKKKITDVDIKKAELDRAKEVLKGYNESLEGQAITEKDKLMLNDMNSVVKAAEQDYEEVRKNAEVKK